MRILFRIALILWGASVFPATRQPPCALSATDTEFASLCDEASSPYAERVAENVPAEVTDVFRGETTEWVDISVAGQVVRATPGHLFRVGEEWVEARNLRAGMLLQDAFFAGQVITEVSVIYLTEPESTYNLEILVGKTYYVTNVALLAHNQCQWKTNRDTDKVAKELGFDKVHKQYSHGRPIYTDGKRFITPDVDSHNGGYWKMGKSLKDLLRRDTRTGTYNTDLKNKIGK